MHWLALHLILHKYKEEKLQWGKTNDLSAHLFDIIFLSIICKHFIQKRTPYTCNIKRSSTLPETSFYGASVSLAGRQCPEIDNNRLIWLQSFEYNMYLQHHYSAQHPKLFWFTVKLQVFEFTLGFLCPKHVCSECSQMWRGKRHNHQKRWSNVRD